MLSAMYRVLEELLQRNSWIETERRYFNQPGSDYDFSRVDPEESKKEYERLLDEQEKAGKRINKKVVFSLVSVVRSFLASFSANP